MKIETLNKILAVVNILNFFCIFLAIYNICVATTFLGVFIGGACVALNSMCFVRGLDNIKEQFFTKKVSDGK